MKKRGEKRKEEGERRKGEKKGDVPFSYFFSYPHHLPLLSPYLVMQPSLHCARSVLPAEHDVQFVSPKLGASVPGPQPVQKVQPV